MKQNQAINLCLSLWETEQRLLSIDSCWIGLAPSAGKRGQALADAKLEKQLNVFAAERRDDERELAEVSGRPSFRTRIAT